MDKPEIYLRLWRIADVAARLDQLRSGFHTVGLTYLAGEVHDLSTKLEEQVKEIRKLVQDNAPE